MLHVCRGGGEPGLYCKWNCSIMTRKVTFFILMMFLVIWHGESFTSHLVGHSQKRGKQSTEPD